MHKHTKADRTAYNTVHRSLACSVINAIYSTPRLLYAGDQMRDSFSEAVDKLKWLHMEVSVMNDHIV